LLTSPTWEGWSSATFIFAAEILGNALGYISISAASLALNAASKSFREDEMMIPSRPCIERKIISGRALEEVSHLLVSGKFP